MADPRLIRTADLDPAEIDISHRLRPVSPDAVAALVASIGELGHVMQPVQVREVARKGAAPVLRLMAGAHRVEACRQLGRPVPAQVWACTDDQARLFELDDNLASADLTALDMAVFLAERRKLYVRLHPETARGKAGASARWDATDIESVAFARVIAQARGVSERHVRRLAMVGDSLTGGEVEALRRAPCAVTLADLLAVAKSGHRGAAIERFAGRGMASLRQALADVAREEAGEPGPDAGIEAAFKALSGAWNRAPLRARRRFAAEQREALAALLADVDGAEDGDDRA